MGEAMQRYVLKNLDCADCAAEIEIRLQKTQGVTFAAVNFATATLTINAQNLESVIKTIKEIEPQVKLIRHGESQTDRLRARREVLRMGLSIPLFLVGLILYERLHDTPYHVAEYAVLLPAYLISGWTVLSGAIKNIRQGRIFDEYFLMTVATGGAWLIHETPEAVGVMIFYMVGEFLQGLSVDRSRRSIQSLLAVRPDRANVLVGGALHQLPAADVKMGAQILINPGDRVPLDGSVIEGHSMVDASALTGESVPVAIQAGSEVLAGMINRTGMVKVVVSRPYEESAIARILHLVEDALMRKAGSEKFITRFARIYSPIVVGIAILVALIPPVLLPGATFTEWFYRALVVLVISCPCALVVSIPLSYFGGVGAASKRGILVKGSNYLDILAEVQTVVFDKTGTLTQGVFKVVDVRPVDGISPGELLKVAAQAEAQSNHPIAQSIIEAYRELSGEQFENLQLPDAFEETPGRGVQVVLNGDVLLGGSYTYLIERGVQVRQNGNNGTAVHLARNNEYLGYVVIADELKADAVFAVQELRRLGVARIVMLTGDSHAKASEIANQLGITEFLSSLMPEDKVFALEQLMPGGDERGKVAFVGDGINDAPVIARSDAGIAMGGMGSEAAIESADIVIMGDSPAKVSEAITIGRRTRSIVWQNIVLALAVKGGFIALGISGGASMWEAVFADMGVALLAILNAVRVAR